MSAAIPLLRPTSFHFPSRFAENDEVSDQVARILQQVRQQGDAALRNLTAVLDGISEDRLQQLEVSPQQWHERAAEVDPALRAQLHLAAQRIRAFHENQRDAGYLLPQSDGTQLGQWVRPLGRVGIYAPGGRATYPSSVLMDALPAKVAGVQEIILCTPPGAEGLPQSIVLAAAEEAGVDRVFRIGGAQAIAALAFGTESVPKVEKVVGPGNAFVAEAKRQLFGVVGIDNVAGPTEVAVLADGSVDARWIAADLLAQAEHDERAAAIAFAVGEPYARQIQQAVEEALQTLPRAAIAGRSLQENGAVVVLDNLEEGIALINAWAPEHCELAVADPWAVAGRVFNAGALFLGAYSPEPVGDYLAGPNHVLPTNGTARFASPLGVYDFVKRQSIIAYTPQRLAADSAAILALARTEGLEGHARAVAVRQRTEGEPQ